jgi:hypothetical protein
MTHEVLYNRGAQTLRWAPQDELAAVRSVSGATYSIVDLREPEDGSRRTVVASTAATVAGTSTTTTAEAGPSSAEPRRLSLTSSAGFRRGSTYLLTSGARAQAVTVERVAAGEVWVATEIREVFAVGATLAAVELEGTFPSDDAADELRLRNGGGPFQVTWVYTLDSKVYLPSQTFFLTRYGVQPWVKVDDALRYLPGLARELGEDTPPEEALRAATNDVVARVFASGRDMAYLRSSMDADAAVSKLTIHYLLLAQRREGARELALDYREQARQHLDDMLVGQPSQRTSQISHDYDTAPAGTDRRAVGGFVRRA